MIQPPSAGTNDVIVANDLAGDSRETGVVLSRLDNRRDFVITLEQALFLRDDALDAFKAEHAATRRVIEAVPVDRSDFKHDEVAKSAIELAWHIVAAEHRFIDAVVSGGFDFTNTGRPAALQTSADVSRWYAETFERDLSRLSAVTAEHLVRPIDLRGFFTQPAVRFLRFGLDHSIHHRGQLSMYLRPMGVRVPAIYGESYDTARAKASAAQPAAR